MNCKPSITVITVCFNSERHIADAVRSVDVQTWPNFEHIIVDGASKDGTLRILAALRNEKRRVTSEPDRGIYDAMNKGLALAQGDIVGFINSDDLYPSPLILEQVANVFLDDSVDACYGDLCYVKQNDTSVIVRYWRSCAFKPGLFARAWCPPHPTLFVRRHVYERLGRFDLRYPIAADAELMARFLEVHRIRAVYVNQVLVHMRMGGTTNRSLRNIIQQNREIWRALKHHRLAPSLPVFLSGKLIARARQFLSRPNNQ